MKLLIKNLLRFFRLLGKNRMIAAQNIYTAANPLEIDLPPGNNFLIIAPHPDDEIIGCGGLLVKLSKAGKKIILFYNKISDAQRKNEAEKIADVLKINAIFTKSYFRGELKEFLKTNNFDTIIIPNIIDNHKDHFQTVTDIYHILKNSDSKDYKILMYEIWTPHQPNIIIDISAEFSEKIKLLKSYESQLANKNYINSTTGLNAYRSIYLKNKNNNAESFILLNNTNDFIDIYESLTKI